MTITLAEAKGLSWIPLIEEKFAGGPRVRMSPATLLRPYRRQCSSLPGQRYTL